MSLNRQQALEMFRSDDLIGIGMEADAIRRSLHPEDVVSYRCVQQVDVSNAQPAVFTYPTIQSANIRLNCATADRLESESLDFHQRVRQTFRALAEVDPDRYLVLDATQSPEQIAAAIRVRVADLLSGLPLQTVAQQTVPAQAGHRSAHGDGALHHPHAQTGSTPQLHP